MNVGLVVTAALIGNQFLEVGLKILLKAAINDGMSDFVFVVYSNLAALFLLLPSTFLNYRKRPLPPISTSILWRIFLLGALRTANQTLSNAGIGYSSATLASSIIDLIPAFTFILGIFSRMENLNTKADGLAKIGGTVISIVGGLIMTLYKGIQLISGSLIYNDTSSLGESATSYHLSHQSNWILGGFLLAIGAFFLAIVFIVQTWIMKDYPEELVVTSTCCGFVVIQSAIVTLFLEANPKVWILRPHIQLVAVLYSGIVALPIRGVLSAWACRIKGPLFVSMFNPFGMIIAFVMGIIFLGDKLYLGSIIGAIAIAIGFYAVLWAKAQEEIIVNEDNDKNEFAQSSTAPLLPNKSTDCT